ncbi:MAG: hypothetical protein PHW03_00800 [Eubacteriales bacterium]|nr:hypothetical protein [Eubacteriales bacterium]MDD4389320.1 hypothetical protein [Eubacteriales bacterium]
MKSKASYFSLSGPLMKENLRRFWAVPALSFLVYFLSGIFPILMSYANINNIAAYIGMTLNNQQPFFCIVHLVMPIAASVVVLRYLQQSSSVTFMNSLPVSRARLFNSHVLSGWIMCIVPIIVTSLLLFLLSTPTYRVIGHDDYGPILGADLFTNAAISGWLWQSVLVVTFIYAIAMFAGMVTGNSVLHLLLSFTFAFLLPSIWLALVSYFEMYLWGHLENYQLSLELLPWLNMLQGKAFDTVTTLVYIAVIVSLIVACAALNFKRKIEKTGDGVIFNFMIPILCYLIAFVGMSLFGFYFDAMAENKGFYMYAGMASGSIIFFIIARMLVLKTPRIFNKQTLKSFAVYGLIATLFTCALVFDLTGFENRLPKEGSFASANIDVASIIGGINYDQRYTDRGFRNNELRFTEPENLEAIRSFHKAILDNKSELKDNEDPDFYYNTSKINYYNDKPYMSRSYRMPYGDIGKQYLADLYESKEFKDYYSLKSINTGSINKIQVSFLNANYDYNISKSELDAFIAVLDNDFADRTYEDHLTNELYYAQVTLDYRQKEKTDQLYSLSLEIMRSDTNTIKWLEDRGYSELRASSINSVAYATVNYETYTEKFENNSVTSESGSTIVKTITDKKQIAYILEHGFAYIPYGINEFYSVTLEGTFREASDNLYYDYEKKYSSDPFIVTLYFTPENAPDFVKK